VSDLPKLVLADCFKRCWGPRSHLAPLGSSPAGGFVPSRDPQTHQPAGQPHTSHLHPLPPNSSPDFNITRLSFSCSPALWLKTHLVQPFTVATHLIYSSLDSHFTRGSGPRVRPRAARLHPTDMESAAPTQQAGGVGASWGAFLKVRSVQQFFLHVKRPSILTALRSSPAWPVAVHIC
jgi:hypothetical protein